LNNRRATALWVCPLCKHGIGGGFDAVPHGAGVVYMPAGYECDNPAVPEDAQCLYEAPDDCEYFELRETGAIEINTSMRYTAYTGIPHA